MWDLFLFRLNGVNKVLFSEKVYDFTFVMVMKNHAFEKLFTFKRWHRMKLKKKGESQIYRIVKQRAKYELAKMSQKQITFLSSSSARKYFI